MAHFAQLNEQGIVTQIIVVANDELLVDGVENEAKGIAFCQALFGGDWKQTSYSGSIRKNYAGLGYVYDAERDAFIPPQPYPSWVFVEETCNWIAPVPYPTNGGVYQWDEETTVWVEFIKETR